MLASTKMIEHFLSHRKGNTSVKQQEIKHFMVQCPNFMLKIYVQLPKVLLYNKQPFQSIKRGNCQWPLQGRACPLLFLDQTEAQRAQKMLFWDCPPPLISGSGWPGLPLYLKAWIHHWLFGSALINSYKRFSHSA